MAVGVVHLLELVDVKEQHCGGSADRAVLADDVGEAVGELPPVRQPGQRVVARQMSDLFLRLSDVGHIVHDHRDV